MEEQMDLTMVQVSRELHEKLKIRSIQLKKTLRELVNQIVSDYLKEEGK
jgi:hypothetical protein